VKLAPTVACLTWLIAGPAVAADPPADDCFMLNNRVLGPRTENRPLPLMKGDAARGFAPACAVAWSVLSPKNDALPVEACYRGSLLQLPNDSACGPGTGKLWIGTRWVVTTADLSKGNERAAVCQQLETGAWAGTRAFSFECKPRSRELDASTGDEAVAASKPAGTADTSSRAGEPAKPATPAPKNQR